MREKEISMIVKRGTLKHASGSNVPETAEAGKDRRLAELELEQTRLQAQIRVLQESRQELQDSYAQLTSHYENSPIAYVTFDQKTHIQEMNSAAAKLFCCDRTQLLNKPFALLVERTHTKDFLNHLMQCKVAGAKEVRTEVRLLKTCNEAVPVQLVTIPFGKEDSKFYQTALLDLTHRKTSEHTVQKAKEFAESIVQTVREPLVVLDANLRVISVNRAFTELFDKKQPVAKGRFLDVLLNLWWSGNTLRHELEKVLEKHTLDGYRLDVELPGRGKRVLVLNARRLYQKENMPPQLLVALEDITEKTAAEEKLRKNERMLAEAQRLARIGSWEWEIAAGKITWSDELYRIFEIAPDDFKGTFQGYLDCINSEDRERVRCMILNASQNREPFDFFHRTGCSEKVRTLHCRGYVASDAFGHAIKVIGTAQDVTELKEAEERLFRINEELEDRVKARTQALQQSYKQMEAFCYSIAHDLRAPLRAMKGFADALAEDYEPKLDQEGKDYLDRIVVAADRMDHLINDLLDYGRLNTVEVPIEEVDAEQVICRVLNQQLPEIEYRKARIAKQKKMPSVRGHTLVLEIAMTNIIANALKFVAPGVVPKIEIGADEDGETVRIWVKDNGIGIAPEHQKRIFEVFQRLHGQNEFPGTGIGLALVTKGIERIGGKVGVESAPNKGSRFWMQLPKVKTETATV